MGDDLLVCGMESGGRRGTYAADEWRVVCGEGRERPKGLTTTQKASR